MSLFTYLRKFTTQFVFIHHTGKATEQLFPVQRIASLRRKKKKKRRQSSRWCNIDARRLMRLFNNEIELTCNLIMRTQTFAISLALRARERGTVSSGTANSYIMYMHVMYKTQIIR